MREFAFAIEYARGTDPVVDAFAAHPSLRSEAFLCCPGGDRTWRVERVTGRPSAVEAVRPFLADEGLDRDSVGDSPCDCDRTHEAVAAGDDRLVVYSYLDGVAGCVTVPSLAARALDGGLLFHAETSGTVREWRVLLQNDQKVGLLYDALGAKLREGLRFRFGHLGDATGWERRLFPGTALPHEQHTALEAALERGYYETPREVTLDDLAADLDVPRSTLSYRLRQAEARLVAAHLDAGADP